MNKLSNLSRLAFVAACMFFNSCDNVEDTPTPTNSVVPERFSVEIPSSLNSDDAVTNGRIATNGRTAQEAEGGQVYRHLRTFVHVGHKSAKMVEEIMQAIRKHNINRAMSLTFQSQEDGRDKHLVVSEDVTFEGRSWKYGLLISDADSEGAADGGKGLEVFWNTSPIEGIAILKPYNIDRTKNANYPATMFRIDYSEKGDMGYEAHMMVQIADLTLSTNKFSVNNLKMFVGRKGEVVDIYGNSNHPNAQFFTEATGYGWAFVASANRTGNFSVAEVGLPYSTIDSPNRQVILEQYSLRNVFEYEIETAYPNATQEQVDQLLQNTEAPGFFAQGDGFVAAGTAPDPKYDALVSRIANLSPFNPKEIASLQLSFK